MGDPVTAASPAPEATETISARAFKAQRKWQLKNGKRRFIAHILGGGRIRSQLEVLNAAPTQRRHVAAEPENATISYGKGFVSSPDDP
jgi:hypothetical protein